MHFSFITLQQFLNFLQKWPQFPQRPQSLSCNDTIKLQGIQDRVLADNTFLLNNKIRTKQLHSAAYERNGSDCFLSRKPVTCPYNTEGIMSLLDDLHIDLWQSRREVEGKQTPWPSLLCGIMWPSTSVLQSQTGLLHIPGPFLNPRVELFLCKEVEGLWRQSTWSGVLTGCRHDARWGDTSNEA